MKLASVKRKEVQEKDHGELICYCENEPNYIETIKTLISKGSEIDDKYNLNNVPKNYPVFLFIRFDLNPKERKPFVYDYKGCEGMIGMIIMNEFKEITHASNVIISALKSNENLYNLHEVMYCGYSYVYKGIEQEIYRRGIIKNIIKPFKEHIEPRQRNKNMCICCHNEQDYIEAISALLKYGATPADEYNLEKKPEFNGRNIYIFFEFYVESSINGYKNEIYSYEIRDHLGTRYTLCGYSCCIHTPGVVKGVLDANESLYTLCHE